MAPVPPLYPPLLPLRCVSLVLQPATVHCTWRINFSVYITTCSCSCHIFSLCQLNTLTIHNHNSISLLLLAQDLPLSQIFSTIDSLSASELTPRILLLDHFFSASRYLWSPYVIGQTIIFLPCYIYLLLLLSISFSFLA